MTRNYANSNVPGDGEQLSGLCCHLYDALVNDIFFSGVAVITIQAKKLISTTTVSNANRFTGYGKPRLDKVSPGNNEANSLTKKIKEIILLFILMCDLLVSTDSFTQQSTTLHAQASHV